MRVGVRGLTIGQVSVHVAVVNSVTLAPPLRLWVGEVVNQVNLHVCAHAHMFQC